MVLLKLSEASKRIGISPQTLRNWIRSGKIKGEIIKPLNRTPEPGRRAVHDKYYMDERVLDGYLKKDEEYYEEENQDKHDHLVYLMGNLTEHIDALGMTIREISTNSVMQMNEAKRHTTDNKLDKIISDQQILYNYIEKCFNEINDLKTSVTKISKTTHKPDIATTTPEPKTPDDPYNKWGGR